MLKRISNGALVDIIGQGEPLIMLHGLGGTMNVWEVQAVSLAQHFQVIRYDMRGSGRTPADGEISLAQWVHDLHTVFEEFELKTASLVGHSLGALVALHFAGMHPQSVKKIAVAGANLGPNAERRAATLVRAEKIRHSGIAALVDATLANGLSPATSSMRPLAVALAREMILAQSNEGYARSSEGMANAAPADLTRIRVPLLAMAGADDHISPPAISEKLVASVADSTLVILASCGHWIPIEQPDLTTQHLLSFL
jgi:3-oxoadipate enol-lactonase